MADTAPAKVPQAEIGYQVAAPNYWWQYENEFTPELQFPLSVTVFDQMRRTDGQVKSVLNAVTLPVLRTPWRLDPAGAREEVVRLVADDLGLPIVGRSDVLAPVRLKDRFSWIEHLRLSLLMLPFGFSYFEQVYRVDDDGSRAHLRKLAYRPPTTIEMVDVASDGGLVGIRQYWTQKNTEPRPIPVDRLVAYVFDREGGNWLGCSILRPVYKNWLLKDRLLRVWAQTIERNGMGIPVYEGADGEASLTAGLNMATSLRAGEAAGAATPFGAKLRLMGVEGTLPDAKPAVEYHDQQIARAVLAHFLNLGQQTGSWALGSTFADFFTLSLQTLAQQVADTATQHIVEDLVDVNWGPDEPAPKLVFDEIGSRQPATAEAMKTLVDAGILHPDEVLETATRQFYGLPPADPATATAPAGTADPNAAAAPQEASFGAESVAAKRAVKAKFNPDQPRDPDGKWGDGVGGAVKRLLGDLVRVHPGGRVDTRNGSSIDWTTRKPNGDYGIEATGDDGTTVMFDMSPAEVEQLHQRLTEALGGGDDPGYYSPAPEGEEDADPRNFDWSTKREDDDGDPLWDLDISGYDEFGEGQSDGTILKMTEDDMREWHTALTLSLIHAQLSGAGGDTVRAAALVASVERVLAAARKRPSAAPDLDDEASWVAAAAGVDTHPGGERLKRMWVYGQLASKWVTWTDLYDHLKKYIKNPEKLKATVSKWYRLRYGHNPPRHHVAASAESASAEALEAFAQELAEDFGDLADDEADEWELGIDALSAALGELSGAVAASFNPRQPRNPAGSPGGGRFRSMVDHLKDAIEAHGKGGGKGHPFDGFDREQLRRVARKRGIELKRGESRDSIAEKLLGHLGGTHGDQPGDTRTAHGEQVVRDAVDVYSNSSSWAGIADVRDALSTAGYSHEEQDKILKGMLRQPDVRIIPVADLKTLSQRERDQALSIGGEGNHMIRVTPEQSEFGPAPSANPRAERLAQRQSEAGKKAAGVGRTPRSEAAADRRRQKEITYELALVQADLDREGLSAQRRAQLDAEKDDLQRELADIAARLPSKRK